MASDCLDGIGGKLGSLGQLREDPGPSFNMETISMA